MIEVEVYPRYMAHQLRTQLNATIVGKLIEINKKKESFIIETDPDGNCTIMQLNSTSRSYSPRMKKLDPSPLASFTRCEGSARTERSSSCEATLASALISVRFSIR